ncbi:MAG: nuclear transport factor 2 family protein [Agarilytica sp.]
MSQLIQNFVALYSDFQHSDLKELARIYSKDVVFADPVHEIRGIDPLIRYFESVMNGVEECRFDCYRVVTEQTNSTVEWRMRFRHVRLGSRLIAVSGVSLLEHDTHITRHRDYYDMGEMLYEQVPVLGAVVKGLKRKLAN